jgi:RNA polymerase sigma-70 factor, ECF subfamily
MNSVGKIAPTTADDRIAAEAWVSEHGDYLFRHALARVRKRETAEDLVQETFVAAWKSRSSFAGRSSERTWLYGILRKKIADHFRSLRPRLSLEDLRELATLETEQFGSVHWRITAAPRRWKNPAEALEEAEFWEMLGRCIGKLPDVTASVFLLREVEEWSSDEICKHLGIKRSNLFVLLYRARLALRRCLELHWFRSKKTET